MGMEVPQNFVQIDAGPTIQYQPRMPGALHNGNITEKGGGFGASSDISFIQAGTNLRFESSHRSGAILLTKFKTFREDVERLGFFKDYMARNYQSWLDYANQRGHMVNLEDIILVTGHDMTLDFAMLAFSSNYRRLGMEFEAVLPGIASASASVWGTWRTTTSVHHNCGPQHREPPRHNSTALVGQESALLHEDQPEFNQCVFVRGFRMRKRAALFPTVIKAAAGAHDLGSGHRFDDNGPHLLSEDSGESEYEVVPVSDTPSFTDPLDPIFRYMFENSSADIAILNDLDLRALMKGTRTSTAEAMVTRLTPSMVKIGPDESAYIEIDFRTDATYFLTHERSALFTPSSDILPRDSNVLTRFANFSISSHKLEDSPQERTPLPPQAPLPQRTHFPPQTPFPDLPLTDTDDLRPYKHTKKIRRLSLHKDISLMKRRVSLLEEALGALQSLVSTQPHPLLQDKSEEKMPPLVGMRLKKADRITEPEEVFKPLGAFSIDETGGTIFHEAYATSEYLLAHSNSQVTQHSQPNATSRLPQELNILSALFPFPPDEVKTVLEDFLPHLPPFTLAQYLAEVYFANGAWSVDPIHRENFMHRVLGECYSDNLPSVKTISADRLATLFMVFAVGTFFDPDKPLFNHEAEDCYKLARACLCVKTVYDHPTVYVVQAMTLMMWFQTLAGHRTQSYRPLLWGVLHSVCQLMDLNRDPNKLGIEGVEAKVREIAFWEVKSLEQWQAFAAGRCATTAVNEDCKQPYDGAYDEPVPREADSPIWFGWKHSWIDAVNTVAEKAFRSKGVTYSRLLEFDKRLRHHHTPESLRWPPQSAMYRKLGRNSLTGMQCMARMILQESGLLHLHRWFFVQAVIERPSDPLDHQFAHSVRTAYQSASAILMCLGTMYGYHPLLMSRCRTAWSNGLSAALTMATLVIYAPMFPLALPAMVEFERACTLFQNTAGSSVQPESAVAMLHDLLLRARQARADGRPPGTSLEETVAQEHDVTKINTAAAGSSSRYSVTAGRNDGGNGDSDHTHLRVEYEPSALPENLRQWWESTAQF